MLIEPGSGASLKTDLLLAAMPDPAAHVPVDISRDFPLNRQLQLRTGMTLKCRVWADFTKEHPIPICEAAVRSRAQSISPGSTVGNFSRTDAASLLETFGSMLDQPDDEQAGVAGRSRCWV